MVITLLHVTLVLNRNTRSELIGELFETLVHILRDRYGVSISLRRVYNDTVDHPRMIVNDYEPVVLSEIPPLEALLKVLLAIDKVSELTLINGVENAYSENSI